MSVAAPARRTQVAPYQRAATARALPIHEPRPAPRRHLQPVPAARPRRRPRLAHALITLGGIGAILLAQLFLSIGLADGAYRISELQSQHIELTRQQHALAEQLELAGSTQNLMSRASAIGMVPSGAPVFLDLATGKASGTPAPARPASARGNLIGNSLIDPADAQRFAELAAAQGGDQTSSGATQPDAGPSAEPTAPGLLPSPTTR